VEYVEVEQKFEVPNREQLVRRLAELGASSSTPVRQIDTYYNAPHRDFLKPEVISEWLRLRDQAGNASVNYKRWLPDGAPVKTHCDEYESSVSDLGALRRMLAALNFTPVVVVNKIRQEWRLGDVVVAIDKVEGLGSYVEFEFDGNANSVQEALDWLAKFIANLGIPLGEPLNIGYPHLLLGREH